jgi:uncharacterized protein YkwD
MRWRHRIALALAVTLSAAAPATADAGRLLAPASECGEHSDVSLPAADLERTMRCLINHARMEQGVGPVDKSGALQRSADGKSSDILGCQDFSHTACGRNAFFWFDRVGYLSDCWGAGEDLAWGTGSYATAHSTMARWLHSPDHRRVILTGRYTHVGVGVRTGSLDGHDGANVWVAHFGFRC